MNKPVFTGILLSLIALVGLTAIFVFMQQAKSPGTDNSEELAQIITNTNAVNSSYYYTCEEADIVIENYTEAGRQLESCFIEYPKEPSREDKIYYIVEDVCGQFTQRFMENMLDKELRKLESASDPNNYSCSYYIDLSDAEKLKFFTLSLEYLSLDSQKKGHEIMGRTVYTDESIPMTNLVVMQESGVINTIYFGLSENKFLSLRPNSINVLSNAEFIQLAINIAKEIGSYR